MNEPEARIRAQGGTAVLNPAAAGSKPGPTPCQALGALLVDHEIVALRDKFPENIADVDWIAELDRDGGFRI